MDGESAALPALAVALKSGARLRVLEWASSRELSVRDVLARWKVLPEGSTRSDVSGLGLAVKKRQASGPYCVDYLAVEARAKGCDLVVLSSLNSRSWFSRLQSRWLGGGSRFGCYCLVAPVGARGFVDSQTGELRLLRVLCCGKEARAVATSVIELLAEGQPEIVECELEDCWNRAAQLPADLVVLAPGHDLDPEFLESLLPQASCPVLVIPSRLH